MGSGGGKYVFPTLSIFTSLISSDFFSRASSSCCRCWESFECFLLPLLLLRFNRSHVHKNRSVITIMAATAMPIIPHSFKPKTFVFLESSLDRLLFPIGTQETRAAPFFAHCLPWAPSLQIFFRKMPVCQNAGKEAAATTNGILLPPEETTAAAADIVLGKTWESCCCCCCQDEASSPTDEGPPMNCRAAAATTTTTTTKSHNSIAMNDGGSETKEKNKDVAE